MSSFVDYFVKAYTELESKSRRNSQFLNRMIKEYKYLRVHPILLKDNDEEEIHFLISFANSTELSYPMGEDLQAELFHKLEDSRVWYSFIETSKTVEELKEVREIDQTLYIETSKFTPIHVKEATWQDLINAPKLRDAELDILQKTFEEYHGIDDDYELTCNLHELFCYPEKKPEELELRIVYEDTDQGRKYGDATILVFWKGEFMALCNEYINRYSQSHSYYIAKEESWHEMMAVLHSLANIPVTSPIRGAEILDMTQEVENIASVPGFTENVYE